jgi:molecular chaperone HscA
VPAEALFQITEPGESRSKETCEPRPSRVVGIDLGTTNSLVATVQGGKPVCLAPDGDPDGDPIVPSVVHYARDGGVVVGHLARDGLAQDFPEDTIASVKRFMGRGLLDADATRALTTYRFAPRPAGEGQGNEQGRERGPEQEGLVRFAVAGGVRAVTPMEVSAEILRALKARAEAALHGPLEGAVITVPAYFDEGQRQATRDAGRLAGLEVLRLLNEPTAAALAYGLDKRAEGTFAVFDLGGGTFDISVLKLEAGVFEVKSTGGDSALGGDDFDRAIAAWLLEQMHQPADAGGDAALARRVLDAARAAKETLSSAEQTEIILPAGEGGGFHVSLDRAAMEGLVGPVLARCTQPVRRALQDAGVKREELEGVILVGGATRMPLVRRFVRDLFAREPLGDIDPDQVVALGAAIQADLLGGGGRDDVVLLDVVPLSLGLEMMGGVVEKLIHRNTTVPCGATQTFTTYADNQTGFDLHVLQGERELAADCRSLARFKLGGIPPLPAGLARLEVSFLVDADGILNVSARELQTGKQSSIQVKPSYGLTDEEVERMLLDSFAHAEADISRRSLAVERVEAERILMAMRSAMEATPALLTDEDREAIGAALATVELARTGTDAAKVRSAIEALDAAGRPFVERRMNRALELGLRGRKVDEALASMGAVDAAGARPGSPGGGAGVHKGHSHG